MKTNSPELWVHVGLPSGDVESIPLTDDSTGKLILCDAVYGAKSEASIVGSAIESCLAEGCSFGTLQIGGIECEWITSTESFPDSSVWPHPQAR